MKTSLIVPLFALTAKASIIPSGIFGSRQSSSNITSSSNNFTNIVNSGSHSFHKEDTSASENVAANGVSYVTIYETITENSCNTGDGATAQTTAAAAAAADGETTVKKGKWEIVKTEEDGSGSAVTTIEISNDQESAQTQVQAGGATTIVEENGATTIVQGNGATQTQVQASQESGEITSAGFQWGNGTSIYSSTPLFSSPLQTTLATSATTDDITTSPETATTSPTSTTTSASGTFTGKNGSAPSAIATGVKETGRGTYYGPGQGACGWTSTDSDHIVAVGINLYESLGINAEYFSEVCGKYITANYKGKSVKVKVVDACGSCTDSQLDFSPSAFKELAELEVGIIQVEWSFDD